LTDFEIESFKSRPFEHQIEGINFLLQHPKALLLDSMGLGKTAEIIWTAEVLKHRGLIDHCLIICGVNSVKQN
jgi:SNF2 family DNA or RNA helicase